MTVSGRRVEDPEVSGIAEILTDVPSVVSSAVLPSLFTLQP